MGRREGKRSQSRRRTREEAAFMADGDEPQQQEDKPADDAPADDTGAAAADDGADGGDAGDDAAAAGDDGDAAADDAPADDAAADDEPPPFDAEAADDAEKDAAQQKEIEDMADDGFEDLDADDAAIDALKARKYAEKVAAKGGAKTRVKMYRLCNMFEASAAMLLKYALDNPMEKDNALGRRTELLSALYYLRHISDVDDDFAIEEYESEMKNIKVYRSKMARLAQKEEEYVDTEDDESSDDELDDADDMDVLKEARKMMEFQFGGPPKGVAKKADKWKM